MISKQIVAQNLCLKCGICCDGTLFKDVELQPSDDAARLRQLGLELRKGPVARSKCEHQTRRTPTPPTSLAQPCLALCGNLECRIYAERPTHCRDFECALFIAVAGGELETTAAQRAIGLARQRAERVRRLLRALGDYDETKALSVRFRKTRRRFENMPIGEDAAATFAQLTLAVHDLNLLLGEKFYPGDADIRCG